MNRKLLALLTVALGAPVALGALTFDIKTPTDEFTGYIQQAVDFARPVYNDNSDKAFAIYNYVKDTKTPNINYLVNEIAQLISNSLKNDKMRNMLNTIYKTGFKNLVNLLNMANAITIPPLAIPFAEKTLGYNRKTAEQFANAMIDLTKFIQISYDNIYIPLIENQLDEIFATQSVEAIAAKLEQLITRPEVRTVILEGLLDIKKNWPFISEKLSEFGFDANTVERIVNNTYAVIKPVDDMLINMPVMAPGVPNIPGVEW